MNGIDTMIEWIEDTVSIVTLAAIVCIVTACVIGRYIFQTSFLWADEVNHALLVAGMYNGKICVGLVGVD